MKWQEVQTSALLTFPDGWKHRDATVAAKLTASVRRNGQLRPVIVRETDKGTLVIVDGRGLAASLADVGIQKCRVVNLGKVSPDQAAAIALSLELGFDVDYARLASMIGAMVAGGASPDELASASPFTAQRIAYYRELSTTFDWDAFKDDDGGQAAMDWGGEPLPTVASPDAGLGSPFLSPLAQAAGPAVAADMEAAIAADPQAAQASAAMSAAQDVYLAEKSAAAPAAGELEMEPSLFDL